MAQSTPRMLYNVDKDVTGREATHAENRETLAKALGLQFIGWEFSRPASPMGPPTYPGLIRYHWPKAKNGGQWDRYVYFLIYGDGSWSALLDDGVSAVTDTMPALLAMAKAKVG